MRSTGSSIVFRAAKVNSMFCSIYFRGDEIQPKSIYSKEIKLSIFFRIKREIGPKYVVNTDDILPDLLPDLLPEIATK